MVVTLTSLKFAVVKGNISEIPLFRPSASVVSIPHNTRTRNADYRASVRLQSMFESYARDTRHENQLLSTCIITGSIYCKTRIFLRKNDFSRKVLLS